MTAEAPATTDTIETAREQVLERGEALSEDLRMPLKALNDTL